MQYGILLVPHANSRYQQAEKPLALAELEILLSCAGIEAECAYRSAGGVEWLCFESAPLSASAQQILSNHSLLYFLAEVQPDGSFRPLVAKREPQLGGDLAGILKYKGKTNEVFTELLVNAAVYSSRFAGAAGERLDVCDPLCGKGTTLFVALNRGWNALGVDVDRADLSEAKAFLKRYLEYHRIKHVFSESSLSAQGRQVASCQQVELSKNPEDFKAKRRQVLKLLCGDSVQLPRMVKAQSFHAMAADLPYGVQHAPSGGGRIPPLESLLERALPAWLTVLKPGGALALSFNTYTLKAQRLRALMEQAGFEVLSGGPYGRFEHWVEQAVNRDIAVGLRRT